MPEQKVRRPTPRERKQIAQRDRERTLDAYSVGTGPLEFDVRRARSHGWSDAAILRTAERLHRMAVRESRIAHTRDGRAGTVPGCPCAHCAVRERPCGYCDCATCYPRPRASVRGSNGRAVR
jgi:hypothetical protein